MSDFEDRARRAARAVRDEVTSAPHDVDRGVSRAKRAARRGQVSMVASGLAAILVVTTIGSGGGGSGESPDTITFGNDGTPFELATSLQAFDECDDTLAYFKREAPELVLESPPTMPLRGAIEDFAAPNSAQESTNSAAGLPGSSVSTTGDGDTDVPDYSRTNVVEAGVDEPDTIKTDGRRIFTVTNSEVQLLEVTPSGAVLRSRLDNVDAQSILLDKNRLLILGVPEPKVLSNDVNNVSYDSSAALYDVTDISKPALLSKLTFNGSIVDARLVDSQVRLVTLATPRIDIDYPTFDNNGNVTEAWKTTVRDTIANSTLEQWLPQYVLTDRGGKEIGKGQLIDCDAVAAPTTFSGLSTLGVATFDMSDKLDVDDAVGVIAGGQQVYATARNLYVSTTDYSTDGWRPKTFLHKFLTSDQGKTTYRASGEISGELLNEYAMSEHDGVLRVASTVITAGGFFKESATHGVVTTLAEEGNQLVQRGQVSGLGIEDNESIRAVRFIGTKGYVVTFRQTDPLYVIDLRDPANPQRVGELKIPGYSGYLHPVGDDLLLGVGQAGGDVGCPTCGVLPADELREKASAPEPVTAQGVQFSLFDVSDPANPKRLATKTYESGQALAEQDAKGFLYWAPRQLAVAPMETYNGQNLFHGAVLLKIGQTTIDELAKIEEPQGGILRSIVIGDHLYTLSQDALTQTDLDSLQRVGRVTLTTLARNEGPTQRPGSSPSPDGPVIGPTGPGSTQERGTR